MTSLALLWVMQPASGPRADRPLAGLGDESNIRLRFVPCPEQFTRRVRGEGPRAFKSCAERPARNLRAARRNQLKGIPSLRREAREGLQCCDFFGWCGQRLLLAGLVQAFVDAEEGIDDNVIRKLAGHPSARGTGVQARRQSYGSPLVATLRRPRCHSARTGLCTPCAARRYDLVLCSVA